MKRKLLVLISFSAIALFFGFMIKISPDSAIFEQYPSVWLRAVPEDVDRSKLEDALDDLGKRTGSLIGLRIALPARDGKAHFKYATYGVGELPKNFRQASKTEIEQADPANSYLILSGQLTQTALRDTLQDFSTDITFWAQDNLFMKSFRYLASPALLTATVLFIVLNLIFLSMDRIQLLRTSGIRILSGVNRFRLFAGYFWQDSLIILLGMGVSLALGGVFLAVNQLHNLRFLGVILGGTLTYALMLGLSSLFMEMLFASFLKHARIVDLIKGRAPIYSLLAVLFLIQLGTVVVVGYSVKTAGRLHADLQILEQGRSAWQARSGRVVAQLNMSGFVRDREQQDKRYKRWYAYVQEAIETGEAVLVEHYLREVDPLLPTEEMTRSLLYVSPEFLSIEHVLSDPEQLGRMQGLKKGEFGLIIPQRYEAQRKIIEDRLRARLSHFGEEREGQLVQPMTPVSIIRRAQTPVFVYNYEAVPTVQFLTDPIIVVITPTLTGDAFGARSYWGTRQRSLYLTGYDKTLELLEKHGLSKLVSYVQHAQQMYEEQTANFRNETVRLLIGSLTGLFAAAATFVAMNGLYFNFFRRSLFIKRISGMRFLSLHRQFLMLQVGVLAVGAGVIAVAFSAPMLSLGVLLIFVMLEMGLLLWQMRQEKRTAVTVLKGE